jgi:hypothetical protein
MPLDHFTTWDDPHLWNAIRDVVTTPKRNAFIHGGEAQLKSAGPAFGEGLDITSVINQHGIPTGPAKVFVSFNAAGNTADVHISKGGTNWTGVLTLRITKD